MFLNVDMTLMAFWAIIYCFSVILCKADENIHESNDNIVYTSIGDELCDTLTCQQGEECVYKERVAKCQCREYCPTVQNLTICGSNGKTYMSHCHLSMDVCTQKIEIHYLHDGICEYEQDQKIIMAPITLVTPEVKRIQKTAPIDDHWMVSKTTPDILKGHVIIDHTDKPSSTFESSSTKRIMLTSSSSPIGTKAHSSLPKATTINPIMKTIGNKQKTTESSPDKCDRDDFIFIPSNLLLYFHAKYADTRSEIEKGKLRLVRTIFSNFDSDNNKMLTRNELNYAENDPTYSKLMPPGCHLYHMIDYGDVNKDGRLSDKEFFGIFGLPIAQKSKQPPNHQVKQHSIEVGKQYQLYCNVNPGNSYNSRITWYRYDVPLVNVVPYNFEVSADSSLYLTPAALIHTGEFRCVASNAGQNVEQKHEVSVQERPAIKLEPEFLLLKSGESLTLRCKILQGYPVPRILWEKNSVKIAENITLLELKRVQSKDTGSYTCVASNGMGKTSATTSIVVRDDYEQPETYLRNVEHEKLSQFALLDDQGIKIWNAFTCQPVKSIFNVNGTSEHDMKWNKILCRNFDSRCQWSDAVITKNLDCIYASLADQKLLVRINVTAFKIEEVFHLNQAPKRLYYVEWDDSVWSESWHNAEGTFRTVQVIRSASKPIKHSLTHALPTHDEYDTVENLFIPTAGELQYGYVTHKHELALHKFDLITLKVVSRISLSPYNCHPVDAAFVYQTGLAAINCVNANNTAFTGQLLIDYMSDAVLNYDGNVNGKPMVTPDGHFLLTVNEGLGRIFIQNISNKELSQPITVDEFLPLRDWTILPDEKVNQWAFYAISKFADYMIGVKVPSGKVEKIGNVGHAGTLLRKPVVLGTKDMNFLIMPSEKGLNVVDRGSCDTDKPSSSASAAVHCSIQAQQSPSNMSVVINIS